MKETVSACFFSKDSVQYICTQTRLTSGHSDVQPWASECPDVKNYKWRLNPVWHRTFYSCCAQVATVRVKEL